MKVLSLAAATFLFATTSFAADMANVAGRYRITRPGSNVVHTLRVESTGAVYLTERSPSGKLECWGSALMIQNTLESAFACENGRAFEHKVFFGGTRFFMNAFRARVFNGADGTTRLMDFRKLANVGPELI